MGAVAECWDRTNHECSKRNMKLTDIGKSLKEDVSDSQKLLLEIANEKGVSSWLTADPSVQFRSILNKSDFRDAVCIRYGYPLDGLPTTCVCGSDLTVDHALTCPCGGYPLARHNEVRDTIAEVMRGVLPDVEVEPQLLPYVEEQLAGQTANRAVDARVDIRAKGFWTRQQEAFFDVRVTHPKATLSSRSEALA